MDLLGEQIYINNRSKVPTLEGYLNWPDNECRLEVRPSGGFCLG